jgi:hypothetical protein
MRAVPVKPAGIFWGSLLRFFDFGGIAMPWSIYVLPGRINDERLIRHERRHIEQMAEDGVVTWFVCAAWYLFVYGYWNSPYEIDARKAEVPNAG